MATKTGIDQDALITMFSQATAKQGEALRQTVSEATLHALQGRELTLKNIRSVLKTVTEAASTGAAQHGGRPAEVEALLSTAIDGMDAALLQAVEANRRALQQFLDQGADLQKGGIKSALTDLEKLEDTFFSSVSKAAQGAGAPLQGPWAQVLESMKLKGTDSGAQAALTVEQLLAQAQSALRDSRAVGLRAGTALMDSYAALVSGVLIGMSEGLQRGGKDAGEGRAAPSRKR
ncbi:DUF6781 family protein [Methylibium sp.]|uniref:DUF6781 family protein n=1 Tax=Methylibium sp. TaxID=2067992 RepID=UPI003D1055A9